MRLLATTFPWLVLLSCTSTKQTSKETDAKSALEWINGDASLKTDITFLQSSANEAQLEKVSKTLQQAFYQNWLTAMKLLKIEISQFSAPYPGGGPNLKVNGLYLIERKRNEISAGAGLRAFGGETLGSTTDQAQTMTPSGGTEDPITQKDPSGGVKAFDGKGLKVDFYLDGAIHEFAGRVRFDNLETNERREPMLSKPIEYWQVSMKIEAAARVDAAALFTLFAKVPPQMADALGSLLKNIGSIDAFIKIINRAQWLPFEKNTKQLESSDPEINRRLKAIGPVSQLSVMIANDIFKDICLYKGFSEKQCEPIVTWTKGGPIVEQIKRNIILPIYRCEATEARENLIPIYNQYVVSPVVSSEDFDFFAADPNKSPVILQAFSRVPGLKETWQRENAGAFGGGRQGVFTEQVPLKECFLSEANGKSRCLKIKYKAHGFGGKCSEINKGTFRTTYGFSLINQEQVIYNPNFKE